MKNNQGKTAGDLAKDRNKTDVCMRILEFTTETESPSVSDRDNVGAGASVVTRQSSQDNDRDDSDDVTSILECPVCLETMFRCR